jgi:hypothetical protein
VGWQECFLESCFCFSRQSGVSRGLSRGPGLVSLVRCFAGLIGCRQSRFLRPLGSDVVVMRLVSAVALMRDDIADLCLLIPILLKLLKVRRGSGGKPGPAHGGPRYPAPMGGRVLQGQLIILLKAI